MGREPFSPFRPAPPVMSLPEGKPTGAYESLATYIDTRNSECLNESDDHPFANCLEDNGNTLQSDCDEQLILSLAFTQDLELTEGQLDGKEVLLKFVKFQDVQNIQFFISDNQTGDEVTQVELLEIFGTPKQTTNMKDLKKAG